MFYTWYSVRSIFSRLAKICASVIKLLVLVEVYGNYIPMKDKNPINNFKIAMIVNIINNFSCHIHLPDIVQHLLMTWINGDPHNVPHGALQWSVDNSRDVSGINGGTSRRNSNQSEALRGLSQSQFLRLFLRTWIAKSKNLMYTCYRTCVLLNKISLCFNLIKTHKSH